MEPKKDVSPYMRNGKLVRSHVRSLPTPKPDPAPSGPIEGLKKAF